MEVDPDDDSIQRFIVRHYRYDPRRRERRHVTVAAFDNESEFDTRMAQEEAELRRRRQAGAQVDDSEHISGTVREPGYGALQRNGHLVSRAIRHGVLPPGLADLPLPSNMALIQAGDDHDDVEADPVMGGSKPVVLRLSHHEAMTLLGCLHDYLRGDRSQHVRRRTGKLIWMLEDADAGPREVGHHSADAVQPATRPD